MSILPRPHRYLILDKEILVFVFLKILIKKNNEGIYPIERDTLTKNDNVKKNPVVYLSFCIRLKSPTSTMLSTLITEK
jgi:hypothetical protein